ncbi:hypothetical protein ACWEFJ_09285 [Actinosynnema sp. NPDC004786]
MASNDRIEPSGEVWEADWVRPRLRRFGSAVAAVVPDGFPAYARVLHPAVAPDGRFARWAEVAARTGRRVHPLAQFAAVARPAGGGAAWPGREPETGALPADAFRELCAVLARHTDAADRCRFCLWEGYGRLYPATPRRGPRVRLPGRDHLLFTGPLAAAAGPGWWLPHDGGAHQTPNLFWPADRAWCVASEIDLHCTFVGGSAALVEEVLAAPGLEAWPVRPGDPVAHDSDHVNTP